jgi:hypothetical protein
MVTIPTAQILEFDTTVDPSGSRHLLSSAVKALDTTANGFLDFENNNVSISGIVGLTKMVVFRIDDMGDASGIYNMKFFLNSATAFSRGTYRFLNSINTHYQGTNFALLTTDLDISTSLPATQNLFSTQESNAISGILDADVSQYVYLAVFTDVDVPFGTYGGGGVGSFRYRTQYDFS